MFGSAFRMRPLPGHEQAVLDLTARWDRERRPKAEGYIGEYILRSASRPGEYVGVVVFRDRETYVRNANDPEQDRWCRELRAHLAEDPTWEDGEAIFVRSQQL